MAKVEASDLKLNLHWHLLLADGVWTEHDGVATFHPAAPLDTMRVQETLHDAVLRIDKVLKRSGWQDRDDDPFADSEPALAELWKAALLGRPIDAAETRLKKAQLRGLPRPHGRNCAEMSGFSLHAKPFDRTTDPAEPTTRGSKRIFTAAREGRHTGSEFRQ